MREIDRTWLARALVLGRGIGGICGNLGYEVVRHFSQAIGSASF